MEGDMHRRKKVNLSVKKDLQVWILKRIAGVVLLSIVLALIILYVFSRRSIGTTFHMAHLRIQYVSDLLLPVILASGGICFLAGLVFALFFPQRIAGPVYRMEDGLMRIARGEFDHVFKLRRTDRFQSLAEAANQAFGRVRSEFREVADGLQEVEATLERGDTTAAREKIVRLRERLGGWC